MTAVPDWLPGVERVAGTSDAGPVLPGTKWSLLLHTDEIDQDVDACVRALRAKSAWSTYIYDWAEDRLVQCVSNNRAAKSLRSGGNLGRTNAARVIQVEIVGRAHDTPDWPALRNQRVGQMIARLHEHIPFRLDMPLTFYGDRAGFTVASKTAPQRMSWTAWYRFDAICGHQHAPANDHWDPGAINTAEILAAARGATTPTPDPTGVLMALTDEQQQELYDGVIELRARAKKARGEYIDLWGTLRYLVDLVAGAAGKSPAVVTKGIEAYKARKKA